MTKYLTKRNIYIALFAVLYISVALVSTIHAFSFFALANAVGLAVLLACTFEIGQASVLFSILTSKKDRSKFVPWCLMCVLTLVQILGNVFSSYRYLITNSGDDLRYFKEPIFVWTDLPDQQCNVILTYIIGAIMPIVALLMTSMVANYLEDNTDDSLDKVAHLDAAKEDKIESIEVIPPTSTTEIPTTTVAPTTTTTTTTTEIPTIEEKQVAELFESPKSHFVNM